MRRIEIKICRKCKAPYRWERGGIIMTPQDYMDMGLCEKCRPKNREKIANAILQSIDRQGHRLNR